MTIKLSHAEGGGSRFPAHTTGDQSHFMIISVRVPSLCTHSRFTNRMGVKPPKRESKTTISGRTVTSIGKVPVATGTDWGGL